MLSHSQMQLLAQIGLVMAKEDVTFRYLATEFHSISDK